MLEIQNLLILPNTQLLAKFHSNFGHSYMRVNPLNNSFFYVLRLNTLVFILKGKSIGGLLERAV